MENRSLQINPPGAPISLRALLLLSLVAHLPAIWFARGYLFLDQQYQYIDPAWHLATGDMFYRTHEWTMGLRSWVYPGFLAGVFQLSRALGIEDAQMQLVVARFVMALLFLIPLSAAWLLLVRWRPHPAARPALLAFGVFFLAILCGSQPNGPNFASCLAVASVLFFYGPGRLWPLVSGLCLGLAFCGRPQDALLGPVLFVAGLLSRRKGAALLFALGTVPGILLQGITDLYAWGHFLHSPFAYVKFNLFDGRNTGWGREPLWYYPAVVLGMLVWVPPFFKLTFRQLREGSRHLSLVLVAAIAYLAVHSIPAHKAARFVQPALALIFLCAFLGFFHTRPDAGRGEIYASAGIQKAQRRTWAGVHLLAFLLASFWVAARGPTQAGAALGRLPDFQERLLVVDGSRISVGGFFFLRRKQLEIVEAHREDWPAKALALLQPPAPKREPKGDTHSSLPSKNTAKRDSHSSPRSKRAASPKGDTHPLYVLACRRPLALDQLAPRVQARLVGAFHDPFNLKKRNRRWIYRLQLSATGASPRDASK
ncbi:MAG TPA: hypothetical protein ENK02_05545 [Planctomycetes bacterium]|nr:hypothetical protein [Planctomycetota bacterium]